MRLYLVRHGKSNAKEINKRQTLKSPLNEEGRKQAAALADRMSEEKVGVIISSKWNRAFQTAKIVSKRFKLTFEAIDGIHKKEQSPKLDGVSFESDTHKRYIETVEKYEANLNWKFEGRGESIRDLINRTRDFQNHLVKVHSSESVLVVSHGLFIRALHN